MRQDCHNANGKLLRSNPRERGRSERERVSERDRQEWRRNIPRWFKMSPVWYGLTVCSVGGYPIRVHGDGLFAIKWGK